MPRRSVPNFPPEDRQALVGQLLLLARLEERATLDTCVQISESYDAGMHVRDLAEVLGTSTGTIGRWKVTGDVERKRRAGRADE